MSKANGRVVIHCTVIVLPIRNIYQSKGLYKDSVCAKNAQVASEGKALEAKLQEETVWLSLHQLADLFGRDKSAISRHLRKVYKTAELSRNSTVAFFATTETKPTHLLNFLVKNHPFVDGNKRIAATLFLWFLEKNAFLYRTDGTKRIADNALVAMTLLIAESRPQEKDLLTRVFVHLIHPENP